ncbi:hypothetical protein Bbelb_308120 [Branchiostoma belcheri]|nr:hypothetical protein Bbelb_308120 [Branchiostoma belcheri]
MSGPGHPDLEQTLTATQPLQGQRKRFRSREIAGSIVPTLVLFSVPPEAVFTHTVPSGVRRVSAVCAGSQSKHDHRLACLTHELKMTYDDCQHNRIIVGFSRRIRECGKSRPPKCTQFQTRTRPVLAIQAKQDNHLTVTCVVMATR